MFKSSVAASIVSLALVFGVGSARACPLAQWDPKDPAAPACSPLYAGAASFQKAGLILATGPSAEALAQIPPDRRQFELRDAGADRDLQQFPSTSWQGVVTAPEALKFDFAALSPRLPFAWRQEAEDLLRQETVAPLASQGATGAALGLLPGPLGAAGAYDALKRLDAEKWRQIGFWTVKRGWEIDYAPTTDTMFYARDFYSPSIQKTLAEAKLGVAVFDASLWGGSPRAKIYVGPFAVADSLRGGQESKVGAHVTLGEIGAFHVTFAGGVAHETLKGHGAFGLIETSWRF